MTGQSYPNILTLYHRKPGRILVILTLLLVVVLSVNAASAQENGGTLIVATEPLGDTLEPGFWSGFGTIIALDNIGEGLTRSDFTSGEPQPGLAESWEISDDGLTYTFAIREDVTFHDGTPLDAEAVVRSLTRLTNPDDPSYVEGAYMQFGHGSANIESIEAVDDMTVEMVLIQPDATMLHRLARPSTYIISPTALDELGTEISLNPVMAGPFKLESFTPGQEVVMTAFDDYWEGRPYLDEVIVRGFANEGNVLAALQSGEVNFTISAPLLAVPFLDESEAIDVEVGPPLVDLFIGANIGDELTANHDIRMAVNYAIDREKLIEVGLNGYADMPASILGPLDLGFDESGREISTYDPELARQYIEDSGLETPIEVRMSFESVRFYPQLAAVVKEDLDAVGFDVILEPLDSTTFWNRVTEGDIQLSINQRSTFVPDPNDKAVILHSVTSANGQARQELLDSAPEMDALIDQGLIEQDPDKRIEIYEQIQALALEEMPYIYLGYLRPPVFFASNIRGIPLDAAAAGRPTFRTVWIEQ
jgi:peptide/nickel transport system substrate-binding protein